MSGEIVIHSPIDDYWVDPIDALKQIRDHYAAEAIFEKDVLMAMIDEFGIDQTHNYIKKANEIVKKYDLIIEMIS